MYKKILLSSAIAVAMGTSGFANAVAIDGDASDALQYASEIAVDGTNGTTLNNAGSNQALTSQLGFSVAGGSTRFIRIDLGSDAEFDGVPTVSISGTAFASTNIAAGGDGESFVIFEVEAAAGGNAPQTKP